MIPVLSEVVEYANLSIFRTSDHKCGIGFLIEGCDIESENPEIYQKQLLGFIRGLPSSCLARVELEVSKGNKELLQTQRADAISELGSIHNEIRLFVEISEEPFLVLKIKELLSKNIEFKKNFKALKQIHLLALQSGLKIRPILSEILKSQFIDANKNYQKTNAGISNGTQYFGILRLYKPGNENLSERTLAKVLQHVPKPFKIIVSWRKLEPSKVKIDLERRLKQTQSEQDPTNRALYESTAKTLSDSLNSGAQFLEYEFIVLLARDSEKELIQDLKSAELQLNQFAEFKIETFGATPSWLATLVGNNQHVTLREIDETFTLMLPVWHQGEVRLNETALRTLPLHREDGSLHGFDLFDKNFSVFNSVIIGTSGKGKSVLTGLISKSLLNDPNVFIIKLDVGGSHSKECELYNGQEYLLELNKPSGINPFEVINLNCSNSEKIGILSKFLAVLISEQNELNFSKELRADIEENIQEYLLVAKNPSLQEFYELQIKFPRRSLLKRWVQGGLYESAFAVNKNKSDNLNKTKAQLRYYNFSQVFQASDPEFSQAGLAAVLAQFNIETLCQDGRRIVLICDETPFFIKSCFEFFKFSTANVRKYGHAVILITQISSDLVVGGDTGILENSPQRFLFSQDGSASEFQNRLRLSNEHMETLKDLKSIPGKFSEVFLQTAESGKKLKIKITTKEYWELTSTKPDQVKLEKLRKAVPELSLKEAIQCLSAI